MRLAFLFLLFLGLDSHAAGSADDGKVAFVRHGCYECHGFAGQGSVAGKKLAPKPLPFEAFSAIVRTSANAMPPFQKAILSDEDLAAIYAYLSSIPAAPDYKAIPLLKDR